MKDLETAPTSASTKQIITQVINAWAAQNKNISSFFEKFEHDTYLNEVAPGRNRAVYLLGHLIAINDNMLPMFELGDKLFPEFEAKFITNPDKTASEIPTLQELKSNWETLNKTLNEAFENMSSLQWLSKHSKVSTEDFAIDPTRNKLNVLIGRTIHEGYHLGQLNLIIPRA